MLKNLYLIGCHVTLPATVSRSDAARGRRGVLLRTGGPAAVHLHVNELRANL